MAAARRLDDDAFDCFVLPLGERRLELDELETLRARVQAIVDDLSRGYLWHFDSLVFANKFRSGDVPLVEDDSGLPSHLHATCRYGDDVEDEWFAVYLAKRITEAIPDVAARIVDVDGEFLLIEAANSLPSWAEPDACSNRVFFYRGKLILIPPSSVDEQTELSTKDALERIERNGLDYVVSNEIAEDVNKRIRHYREKTKGNHHRTTVYAPVGVAALLKEEPGLIAAAVRAFHNRDPIDAKVCRVMKYFPPENRVNISVTFTKCLYAMLMNDDFHADKKIGWNLPPPNSPQYKSHTLGAKLACGFEILISRAKSPESLESNKTWVRFVESLKERGYFQGLLENSSKFNALLKCAEEYFKNNLESVKITPVIGNKIVSLLNTINIDENIFRENESSLPKDDSDEWLYVDPAELENLLHQRYGKKSFSTIKNMDASNFSHNITEFLDHVSGVDGVEFPERKDKSSDTKIEYSHMPERPKRGIKLKKNKGSGNAHVGAESMNVIKQSIDFDADQFSDALQNILDLVIPEDEWNSASDSDIDIYGSSDDIAENMFGLKTNDVTSLKEYMKEMDSELSSTTIGKSFEKTNDNIDIDKNAMVNISMSYKDEAGGAGPAGNLLGPLGITKFDVNSFDDEID